MNLPIFLTFLVPFLLTLFLVWPTIYWAKKLGLVDDPKTHRHPAVIHQTPIPRAGGLPIFLAILFSILLFITIDKKILGILGGSFLLVLIGLLDDKYDLNPYLRFLTNILAAAIVVGSGIGISFITNPLGGILRLDQIKITLNFLGSWEFLVLANIFAIFWIVWVLNMLNWAKGVDGQMPGIAAITFLTLAVLTLRFLKDDPTQMDVLRLSLIGAGASIGFLIFNFHPAKIFPGYSATVLGFLIAVIAILSQAKVGTALLVMAIPAIDFFFTIIRRISQGRSPFWGDRLHLHHRLLDLGFSQRQIALSYWAVCAILGTLSLFLRPTQKIFAIVFLGAIVLGGIIWTQKQPRKEEH